VQSWLAYSGAFAVAFGAAGLCYFAGFYALMTGYGYGFGGFVLLALILPAIAGLVTFGVSYAAFAKQTFDLQGWGVGIAFVAAITATWFGLTALQVLGPNLAVFIYGLVLFVGGRLLTQRAANA